ncbi:FAR-17a/AIG1-like protein [Dipodascopsis tothii]|uniref:FAR-17a/AIG1-like protein n=1 Tax=Dipodascopsis tothii TaxID=44089 RepID=UPI0034CD302E
MSKMSGTKDLPRSLSKGLPLWASTKALVYVTGAYTFYRTYTEAVGQMQNAVGFQGLQYQYLTLITLLGNLIAHSAASAAVLLGSNWLWDAKNLLMCYVAPLEVVVSLVYWPVMMYDRTLVVPKVVEDLGIVSIWFDLHLHAIPTLFALADFLLYSPRPRIGPRMYACVSVVYTHIYWIVLKKTHYMMGVYPYPFMDLATETQRKLMFGAGTCLTCGIYFGLCQVYDTMHRRQPSAGLQ